MVCSHLTFPLIGNPNIALWVHHHVHVSYFRYGYGPIQPVMGSRYLSAAGVRFLDVPVPTTDVGIPYGLLTARGGPYWGYHVPHSEAAMGVDALYTPGSRCPGCHTEEWHVSHIVLLVDMVG